MYTVDVIIPTYKPGVETGNLIKRLLKQTCEVNKIIIVNTEEAYWDNSIEQISDKIFVSHISRYDFDHGGTRNSASKNSDADILVFMTQDAKPYNQYTIEMLVAPFVDESIFASYARQVAKPECNEVEKFTRIFNYPSVSSVKSKKDLKELGIKTYFCSNVCAAYRRDKYNELGGFDDNTIFGEDMIFASKIINAGGRIAYTAKAIVIHSHNYTIKEQFKRNFDVGVNQKQHQDILGNIKSESEGIRLVTKTALHILEINEYLWIGYLFMYSAAKYLGYKLGCNYDKLPLNMVKKCSMKPEYFNK